MGSGTPYFIPLEEAIEITLKRRLSPDSEVISIDEAFHRILSESLSARTNDPPFDNSAMDGFAFYKTQENSPVMHEVIGSNLAGQSSKEKILSVRKRFRWRQFNTLIKEARLIS